MRKPDPNPRQNTPSKVLAERLSRLKTWVPLREEPVYSVITEKIPEHRQIAVMPGVTPLTEQSVRVLDGYRYVEGWRRQPERNAKGRYLWEGQCVKCRNTTAKESTWFLYGGACPYCNPKRNKAVKGNAWYGGYKPFTALYVFYASSYEDAKTEADAQGYAWFTSATQRGSHKIVWQRSILQGDSPNPVDEPPEGTWWMRPSQAPWGWVATGHTIEHLGTYWEAYKPPTVATAYLDTLHEIATTSPNPLHQAAAAEALIILDPRTGAAPEPATKNPETANIDFTM